MAKRDASGSVDEALKRARLDDADVEGEVEMKVAVVDPWSDAVAELKAKLEKVEAELKRREELLLTATDDKVERVEKYVASAREEVVRISNDLKEVRDKRAGALLAQQHQIRAYNGLSGGVFVDPSSSLEARFWEALLAGVKAADKGAGVVVYAFEDPDARWPIGTSLGVEELFVRRDVQVVVSNVLKLWRNGQSSHPFFVVTGTPGIGKSTGVINYALIELVQQRHAEPVIVDYGVTRNRYVFWPDSRTELYEGKAGTPPPLSLQRHSVIHFFDPAKGDAQRPPAQSPCTLVIVSSPNQNNYKQALAADEAHKMFIYPWTLEELLAVTNPGDHANVRAAFEVCGGVIRYVHKGAEAAKEHVDNGISGSTGNLKHIRDVLCARNGMLVDDVGKLPHSVVSAFPPEDEKQRYSKVRTRFASAYAERRFFEVLSEQKGSEVLRFLQEMLRQTPTLYGRFYEAVLLKQLASADTTCRVRTLTGTERTSSLTLLEAVHFERDDPVEVVVEALRSPPEERKQLLVTPLSPMHPAYDGVALVEMKSEESSEWVVLFLQVTIASTHSYDPKRVYDAARRLLEVDQSMEWHFAAVVPTEKFRTFRFGRAKLAPNRSKMSKKEQEEADASVEEADSVVKNQQIWVIEYRPEQ